MNSILTSSIVLGGFAFVFGVVIFFLDKKLKVEEDPLVEKIMGVLPGVNCGACGLVSCHNFAEYCAQHKILDKACIPGGESVNQAIAALLGVTAAKVHRRVPVCACTTKKSAQKRPFDYDGPAGCSYAHLAGGNLACKYGCLSLGDCARVCPVAAIAIVEGAVQIDYQKCIGCGKCAQICPRKLFTMVLKAEPLFFVACSNPEDTLETKKVCSAGCIGCGICVKAEPNSPFQLKDRLSVAQYDKLASCSIETLRRISGKCPVLCIDEVDVHTGRRSSGSKGA